jgi:hypothetical protein
MTFVCIADCLSGRCSVFIPFIWLLAAIAALSVPACLPAYLPAACLLPALRRYFLSIGGADSAALVWLNGVFVGACKDSRLPSEWEVTHLLQPTDNLLAVQVREQQQPLVDVVVTHKGVTVAAATEGPLLPAISDSVALHIATAGCPVSGR